MSVIIKGIDMPDKCSNCPLCYDFDGDRYLCMGNDDSPAMDHKKIFEPQKPDFCPLAEYKEEKMQMNDKEIEFFDFVFDALLGSDTDEDGEKYSQIYIHELHELITDMKSDLDALLDVYGLYMCDDIEKLFAIKLYGIIGKIEDTEPLFEIAIKFDELYGD